MNITLKIDTNKAVRQYKVVVIDCWSVLGDHAIPPEPRIVEVLESESVEKVVGDKGTILILSQEVMN